MKRIAYALSVLVCTFSSMAQAQDGNADEQGRRHYRLGRAYYDNGQFTEAAAEFDKAYELSHRPQLLYNVYVAHRDAGDLREATEALRQYLTRVPDAPDRDSLRARLTVMERQVAAPNTADTATGGTHAATNAAGTATGGTHTATNTAGTATDDTHAATNAAGTATARTPSTNVEAQGSSVATTSARRTAASTTHRTGPPVAGRHDPSTHDETSGPGPVPFIVGGVGLAAIGVATTFAILASADQSTLLSKCPTRADCDPSLRGTLDQGKAFAAAADVLGVAGGVAVGVAIALFFAMQGDHGHDEHAPQVSAMCTTQGCSAQARLRF